MEFDVWLEGGALITESEGKTGLSKRLVCSMAGLFPRKGSGWLNEDHYIVNENYYQLIIVTYPIELAIPGLSADGIAMKSLESHTDDLTIAINQAA